jgi:serine/threonine-protein kinase
MGSNEKKFKLIKLLGSGGFAHTWLVEVLDKKLYKKWGREVVLKIPLSKEKEFILINELINNANLNQNLQGINAQNIVKYLGFDEYDNQYVMVMEYVEGEDLRKLMGPVGDQNILPLERVLEISKQICTGLIQMHKFHVYHRDIKPENILISKKEGEAKIMDLGIAKMIRSTELASTTTGTIYYMPKEILMGDGGAFYSDIYSLGVTMYEMVTGQLPFNGEAIAVIVNEICNKEPLNPKIYNKDLDDKLCNIILKAMEKDPSRRYQTAINFLEAIQQYELGSNEEEEIIENSIKEAEKLFLSDHQPDAEKILIDLNGRYSNNPKTYLYLGIHYNRCHKYCLALDVFNKGFKVKKDFALLYLNAALSLSAERKYNDAKKNLQTAIIYGLDKKQEDHARKLLEIWENK